MDPVEALKYNAAANDLFRSECMQRWSFMLRPRLSIDGNQWCALYGENLQDGVAGFGDSPEAAYDAFDKAWVAKLPTANKTKDEIMALHDRTMAALR
jgi:hypothetical protein